MTEWSECRDCHRPLKSREAKRLGYGRDCARKRGLLPPKRHRGGSRPIPRLKPAPVPAAPDTIPGQEALELFFMQPSLESL